MLKHNIDLLYGMTCHDRLNPFPVGDKKGRNQTTVGEGMDC